MALAKSTAAALVQKFAWMPFFPKDNKDGVAALVDALMDSARDESHARRIAEQIQAVDERSPMPARIRAASMETLGFTDSDSASCPQCSGTGWVYVDDLGTHPGGIGFVRRCGCMAGKK